MVRDEHQHAGFVIQDVRQLEPSPVIFNPVEAWLIGFVQDDWKAYPLYPRQSLAANIGTLFRCSLKRVRSRGLRRLN